jgi:limonene-1,2-epoxide hydrolase
MQPPKGERGVAAPMLLVHSNSGSGDGSRAGQIIQSFWAAMQDNDWARAADHLAEDCVVDWPCSGERIVGREDFALIQARYPTTTGRWTFDLHRLAFDDRVAVSEVTVTDASSPRASSPSQRSTVNTSPTKSSIGPWPTTRLTIART